MSPDWVPHFDLQGGVPLCAARSLVVMALLSAFGTLVFQAVVMPRAASRLSRLEIAAADHVLRRVVQASAALGLLALPLWLVLQAATIAEAATPAEAFTALPIVLAKTSFGHILAAQTGCIAALLAIVTAHSITAQGITAHGITSQGATGQGGPRASALYRIAALPLATLALLLQAGHSHAFSMDQGPSLLLLADGLHLLGAGAWLGGLLPLLLVIRLATPRGGASAARWFSPLGQACLVALLASAAFQFWVLIGTLPGVLGTAYGWLVIVKSVLFAVLTGFAWFNRYRFAPALLRQGAEAARPVLLRSIALQTGFALAITSAAAVLSSLPPSMHQQPLWPFAQQFSTAALAEDPDIAREVLTAAAALAAVAALGLAACLLALARRRHRRITAGAALAALLLAAWRAAPHLTPLLVPAYPTSFYRSPTGFTADSIAAGAPLFAAQCTACHGPAGMGNGPLAASLKVPPANLTASHLWMHQDGELFWWISHGISAPDGTQAMPGFAGTLEPEQIWSLIDFIRANNAGHALQAAGDWPHVIQAPGFSALCGGAPRRSADFPGQILQLRFTDSAGPSAPAGVTTILAGAAPAAGSCAVQDLTVRRAYAIAAGLPPEALAGTAFLIDTSGFLRAFSRPAWPDAAALAAAVSAARHPAAPPPVMPMCMPGMAP